MPEIYPRRIYKQALEVTDSQTVRASEDAEFLTVQTQNGVPVVWFITSPDREQIDHELLCFGTGHAVRDSTMTNSVFYLATTQEAGGRLVWHWFQNIEIRPLDG